MYTIVFILEKYLVHFYQITRLVIFRTKKAIFCHYIKLKTVNVKKRNTIFSNQLEILERAFDLNLSARNNVLIEGFLDYFFEIKKPKQIFFLISVFYPQNIFLYYIILII